MIVGFDLDNTIICYDKLFWRLAREEGLITEETPERKEAVKEAIFARFGEDRWTALQGVGYGPRLLEAEPFPHALETIQEIGKRHEVFIVSHKTRHPVIGPPYDLQEAARSWLDRFGVLQATAPHRVFFEETRAKKVARITELRCDVFVDDLPEVFHEPGFPVTTTQILFSTSVTGERGIRQAPDWRQIRTLVMEAVGEGGR